MALTCEQEAFNLFVPDAPRHVTTLARFTRLRRLGLVGLGRLDSVMVRKHGADTCLRVDAQHYAQISSS